MTADRDLLARANQHIAEAEAKIDRLIRQLSHEQHSKDAGLRLLDVLMKTLLRMKEHRARIQSRIDREPEEQRSE